MSKRRFIMIVVAAVGLVLAGILLWPSHEPTYKRRKLSEWVCWNYMIYTLAQNSGRKETEEDKERAAPIAHIGTNAIPYLLDWIQYQHPAWRDKEVEIANVINPWLHRIFGRGINPTPEKEYRAEGSLLAFKILGRRAEGAIPKLVHLMNDAKRPVPVRARAAHCLGFLGPKACPPLMQALTNWPAPEVVHIITSFGSMGTNARPAIPIIINFLGHSDQYLFINTVYVLGKLKLEPQTVVPALTACLTNSLPVSLQHYPVQSLGKFGPDARSAIPVLQQMLIDPSATAFTNNISEALHQIDSKAFPNPALPTTSQSMPSK